MQTLIALLEAVDDQRQWTSVTLEPNVDSDKVDILWQFPDRTKAVQVKSSQNPFRKSDIERWATDLAAWRQADEYELRLIGTPGSLSAAELREVRKVHVPPALNLDARAFLEQAAHRLDRFLQSQGLPRGNAAYREMIAGALTERLAEYSTEGRPLQRASFVKLLREWIPADRAAADAVASRRVGRRSDRKALRRYLDQLIDEHRHFTFLGRAKPLELEKIYIALKVGEYVPPDEKLEDPTAVRTEERVGLRSGAVQAAEALLLDPPRLLVLGEPGSGKTTLLKYLAVRIASRDPAFGEFSRKRVPNTCARWLDGMHRRLGALNVWAAGLFLSLAGLLAWCVGLFFSPHPIVGLLGLVTLFCTCFVIAARVWVAVCSSISVALLVFFGVMRWMPGWSVGAVALPLVLLLEAYWIRPFLRVLRWRRDRSTNYPLPLFLTLNDQIGGDEPLDSRLARPLEDAGFADAPAFLRRRLESGECLLLMDGLDEVVDGCARDRIAEWLGHTRIHARNPMLVTCRIAAFEAHPLEHRFSGFRRVEVQEFTDRQVELFIRNWFADRPAEEQQQRVAGLFAALGRNARMRLLAANPLLLSLIALVFERDWTLPDKRFELYDKCVDVLLEEWDKAKGLDGHVRFDQGTKRLVLQCLAIRFHEAGIRQFTQEDLTGALPAGLAGLSAADRDQLVQEIMLRSNLIRRKSRTSYDFAHLTFQEYFTARDFAERGDLEGLLAHLGDPWWREVILLFAGLQRDATGLLVRLRKHDVLIAASALADARTVPAEEFAEVADGTFAELKHWMETACGRGQEAADALAEIPRSDVREYLVEQTRREGRPDIALAAVLALGRCADRFTLDSLWPQPGRVLRLLHGCLCRPGDDSTQRVLTVLERLGFEWVFVPAGEFVIGEGPSQRDVHLEDFWIAKYPVTNAQFARFVEETKYQEKGDWRSTFTPGKESHPVVNVSWDDAMAFCRWAGVTLPSEEQWEKAARGTDGRIYPWGNRWDAARCNSGGVGTTPVDQYPNGVSPYGCYDMAGNVWEWCDSWYSEQATHRVSRGGCWAGGARDCRSAYRVGWSEPADRYERVGFRVVAAVPQAESSSFPVPVPGSAEPGAQAEAAQGR